MVQNVREHQALDGYLLVMRSLLILENEKSGTELNENF